MAGNNTQDQKEPSTQRLTYQPFLLATTVIALLVKVVISLSAKEPILDWLFAVVVILFIATLLVYVWDQSQKGKTQQTSVSISTGKAVETMITGIKTDSKQMGEESVNIKTGDVERSPVVGIERRQENQH